MVRAPGFRRLRLEPAARPQLRHKHRLAEVEVEVRRLAMDHSMSARAKTVFM
jgi:hypothetical protein